MLENIKANHKNEQHTSAQIISPDKDLVKSTDESSVNNDEKKRKCKKHTKKSKKAYKYHSSSTPLSREYEKEISKAAGGCQEMPTKVEYITERDVKHHMHNFKPSAQINLKSYLGAAFKEAQEFRTQTQRGRKTHNNLNSSSEDSDSESSNSSYYSDTSDDSSTDPLSDSDISPSDPDSLDSGSESSSDSDTSDDSHKYYKQRNNKKSKKYCRQKGKKHTKKSLLKPIPPDKYDGAPETQLFHKFITQSMAYLEDGNVPKHCHVYILSNFLTDKAYTFYTRDVSHDPKRWTTTKFFKALFDDVFPVNFCLKQREKLDKFYQNNKTVKTYVAELAELFMSISFSDKGEHVHKLWKGLQCDIQKELWKEKLNPKTSSWKRVACHAKIIELSNSVGVYNPVQQNQGSSSCGDKKRFQDRSVKQCHNHDRHERFRGCKTNSIPGFSSMRKRSQEHQEHGKQNYKDFKKSKLSEKEKEELRAANKCFNCKEVGHTTHTCPKRNNVASTSSNKPPGLQNYNIEITSHEMGYLETLDATTESNNSLELGMIDFEGLTSSEEGSDQSQGTSSPTQGSILEFDSDQGYLMPEDVEDLFEIDNDLDDAYTIPSSDLMTEAPDDSSVPDLQLVTSVSECDDDIPNLQSVSTSSSDESDDGLPDLAEVSDSEDEFDPLTESILDILACQLNNSYFAEMTQLESYDEKCEFNCPVQWSLKIPVVCDETNDPIHMKVLDSENYHGCKYIGDILAIIVRYMLDCEDYPGDEHFPPRKQSCWSYPYRFLVMAISPNILSILDSVQNTRMLVQHEFLENPKLCVTSWYATQC